MGWKRFRKWVGKTVNNILVKPVKFVVKSAVQYTKFVLDKVVTPVLKTVESTVKAALSDPIGTIARVAAYATGQLWAIPLIDGASVLAKGGNLGDALKTAAISYVSG